MKILISVIAYNEEKNIAKTLEDLINANFGYDIVVFDNGSIDKTVEIAKSLKIQVVSHCTNSGSSAGTVMSYFLYGFYYNYDIVCQFDGDGQHLARELPKIINPIVSGTADYVIGSRFLEKGGFQSYRYRRLGISLFSLIDSLIIGQKITDITSGARAYSKKVIRFFARQHQHEIYDTSQLLLLSHFSGARITEVPIIMQEREFGKSEFNLLNAVSFPIKAIINIIGCVLQKNIIRKEAEHGIKN
jgi:glycosyltransferase involved in cell wall biosynthesis